MTNTARSLFVVGCAVLSLVLLAGCGADTEQKDHPGSKSADAPSSHATSASQSTPADVSSSGEATVAGIHFNPPEQWSDLGPSGMRQGQYRFGPIQGDLAPAEVNIFYFGPQSGGGVEANLQRWIGQMILPDGQDPQTAAQRSEFTADGMAGHVISLNGSYKSGGGRPMGGGGQVLEGYRLVGVVLEGPQGSVFFKLTGPVATAGAMESGLLAMVQAAHK